MDSSTKIIIGMVGTAILSLGAHSLFSTGSSFVDTLKSTAQYEISNAGIEGVSVKFGEENYISRNAILSGDVTEDKRNKAITIAENIPGIGSVTWAEDEAAQDGATQNAESEGADEAAIAADAEPEKTADKAIISKCQNDINALMEGKNINFRSGSAYVPPSSYALLDEIIAIVKPCTGVTLEVQGHTDLSGNSDVNQRLSQGRADAVKEQLVKRGLDANAIVAKGYGSTVPLENARTSAANSKNRRTIFVIS